MTPLAKTLARLRSSERGTAVVELAIIAPFLATLIIGVIDISNAFNKKLLLEQAAQRAIEKIMNTSANDTVEATLRAEAAEQAHVALEAVQVTYRLECNGTRTSAESCQTGETQSQWINVAVRDTYKPMFSKTFGVGADGVYTLKGEAGIRIQ